MSDIGTTRMLRRLERRAGAQMFLSGFFQTPEENFHKSEFVELDVIRSEPRIAVPVPSLQTGGRKVEISKAVNKKFKPALYDLETAISAWDTIKRQPGENPFTDPNFLRAAGTEAMRHLGALTDMLRRGVELQAAQVMQTGIISLVDSAGVVMFTIDYQMKSSHKPTVSVVWATDGTTGTPLADLAALAEVVRRDGKVEPNVLVFGTSAWQRFEANPQVKNKLENRRIDQGNLRPELRGQGATYQGFIWIGDYRFDMYTYKETYIHPQTGVHTPYVATDKVIMTGTGARYDMTFGEIPRIVSPGSQVQPFLPERLSSAGGGFDASMFAYVTPNGKQLMLEVGTRALAVPSEIDTLGCLDVAP